MTIKITPKRQQKGNKLVQILTIYGRYAGVFRNATLVFVMICLCLISHSIYVDVSPGDVNPFHDKLEEMAPECVKLKRNLLVQGTEVDQYRVCEWDEDGNPSKWDKATIFQYESVKNIIGEGQHIDYWNPPQCGDTWEGPGTSGQEDMIPIMEENDRDFWGEGASCSEIIAAWYEGGANPWAGADYGADSAGNNQGNTMFDNAAKASQAIKSQSGSDSWHKKQHEDEDGFTKKLKEYLGEDKPDSTVGFKEKMIELVNLFVIEHSGPQETREDSPCADPMTDTDGIQSISARPESDPDNEVHHDTVMGAYHLAHCRMKELGEHIGSEGQEGGNLLPKLEEMLALLGELYGKDQELAGLEGEQSTLEQENTQLRNEIKGITEEIKILYKEAKKILEDEKTVGNDNFAAMVGAPADVDCIIANDCGETEDKELLADVSEFARELKKISEDDDYNVKEIKEVASAVHIYDKFNVETLRHATGSVFEAIEGVKTGIEAIEVIATDPNATAKQLQEANVALAYQRIRLQTVYEAVTLVMQDYDAVTLGISVSDEEMKVTPTDNYWEYDDKQDEFLDLFLSQE